MEPKNNGDPVLHYIVEVMEQGKSYSTDGPVVEHTIGGLEADTCYRWDFFFFFFFWGR